MSPSKKKKNLRTWGLQKKKTSEPVTLKKKKKKREEGMLGWRQWIAKGEDESDNWDERERGIKK